MTDELSDNSAEETGPLTVDQAVGRLLKPQQDSTTEAEDSQEEEAAPEEAEGEAAPEEPEDSEREEVADEDDGDQSEEESDEVSGDPDEEQESESDAPSDDLEIDVQGEKLKLGDLKSGYLRQSDYTRKTQELAQERKQLEQTVSQTRNALEQEYNNLLQAMPQSEAEPDWEKLYSEDPTEYAIQRERFRQRQEERQQIMQRQRELQAQRQQEQQKTVQEKLTNEFQALQEKVPDWKDKDKAKAEINEIKSWVKSRYGFSDEDFNGLHDHRAILILRDAMKVDKMDKKADVAKNKVKDKPRVMKPGSRTRQVSEKAQKSKKLRSNVRKTGKIDDASAYLAGKMKGRY